MKHTPGPWRCREEEGVLGIETPAGHVLAAMHTIEGPAGLLHQQNLPITVEELTANYRLMAAAPDLVRSLQRLARAARVGCGYDASFAECQEALRQANALIQSLGGFPPPKEGP